MLWISCAVVAGVMFVLARLHENPLEGSQWGSVHDARTKRIYYRLSVVFGVAAAVAAIAVHVRWVR